MRKESVYIKLSKVKNTAALFRISGDYRLVSSSNPEFNTAIEQMQNQCVGVYNQFISEKHLNDDISFMEERQ